MLALVPFSLGSNGVLYRRLGCISSSKEEQLRIRRWPCAAGARLGSRETDKDTEGHRRDRKKRDKANGRERERQAKLFLWRIKPVNIQLQMTLTLRMHSAAGVGNMSASSKKAARKYRTLSGRQLPGRQPSR